MVRFVNCFEVPVGREEEFLVLWAEVNAYMVSRAGYVAHELHRSLRPDARYRFVNYVRWESAEHWRAAHDDRFQALVAQPGWATFPRTPALYEVVHSGGAVPV